MVVVVSHHICKISSRWPTCDLSRAPTAVSIPPCVKVEDKLREVGLTCSRHALDACLARASSAVSLLFDLPGFQRKVLASFLSPLIFPAHGRCSHTYPAFPLDHVVDPLALNSAASLLWHSHRLFSLNRIHICCLCVQET